MIALCLFLASCTEEKEATIEEIVVMETFVAYQAALAYDEICNNNSAQDRFKNMNKKENIMLIGHEQMLAARAGGLQHIRFPDATVDELVVRLVNGLSKTKEKTENLLKEKGCTSPEANKIKAAYTMFSKSHPAQIFSLIDKKIIRQGGRVTPVEELNKGGIK